MPIRALCTICSDFFDHSRDVAAIHCGHTFHLQCLIQWFETAPSRTCPQCRIQVGKRTIINKLFFDLAQEEESVLDPEFLKLQTVYSELDQAKLELKSAQKDLQNADKEITSLRKKLTMLQETLNLPPVASETVNRLVLESPAPVEMLNLKLRRPSFGDDIDLNAIFDVNTPPARPSSSQHAHCKKPCMEKAHSPDQDVSKKVAKGSKQEPQLLLGGQRCAGELDEELADAFPVFIRNAVLGQKQPKRAKTESCRNTDAVRTGFDGLGGRTKFIQPVSLFCGGSLSC
uniref:E3 ubiquitin-protein ligase TRAIP n=1 Tax=Oryctolagus cuniculus TaxID=9986 RepID=A0A5F9CKY1_RABIT